MVKLFYSFSFSQCCSPLLFRIQGYSEKGKNRNVEELIGNVWFSEYLQNVFHEQRNWYIFRKYVEWESLEGKKGIIKGIWNGHLHLSALKGMWMWDRVRYINLQVLKITHFGGFCLSWNSFSFWSLKFISKASFVEAN